MTLDDIATAEPDWDAVLVYSDHCEDHDDLATAQALRWLTDHDHWPFIHTITGYAAWWISAPNARWWMDRYKEKPSIPATDHQKRMERGTLPELFTVSGEASHQYDCVTDALEDFVKWYALVHHTAHQQKAPPS